MTVFDVQGSWPATYHSDPVIRHGRPVSLDPNHTHFILVDDGHRNSFRPNVADFRAKLERHIAAPVVSTCMIGSNHKTEGELMLFFPRASVHREIFQAIAFF